MDYQRNSKGWLTLLEHYWIYGLLFVVVLVSVVMRGFTRLTAGAWTCLFYFTLALAAGGAVLLFYSKIPFYRQRRFFTFSAGALPESRRVFYRWGCRCILVGILLLLTLILLRP